MWCSPPCVTILITPCCAVCWRKASLPSNPPFPPSSLCAILLIIRCVLFVYWLFLSSARFAWFLYTRRSALLKSPIWREAKCLAVSWWGRAVEAASIWLMCWNGTEYVYSSSRTLYSSIFSRLLLFLHLTWVCKFILLDIRIKYGASLHCGTFVLVADRTTSWHCQYFYFKSPK